MSQGNQGAAALIVVEITDEPVVAGRPYADKTTGQLKPAISKQNAYLHSGARYPVPFKIIVPEAGPYRPGSYLLSGDVFKPGEYDGLKFFDRALQLVPVADAVRQLSGPAPKLAAAS